MERRWSRLKDLKELTLGIAILSSLSGCVEQYGFDAASLESSGVDTGSSPVPEVPAEVIVCDPNDPNSIRDASLGLKGKIFLDSSRSLGRSTDYPMMGTDLGVELYLNQLNVPTRAFDQGFRTEGGSTLKDMSGESFIEYFGFDVKSTLRLQDSEEEGDYQLAILSDDGASLFLDGSLRIDNEGVHPPKMGCASGTVSLRRDSRVPLRLTYFQGPRYHISLVLMWRKVPTGTPQDPLCGAFVTANFTDAQGAPIGDYQALLSRGWKPLESGNFELQSGRNLCVK